MRKKLIGTMLLMALMSGCNSLSEDEIIRPLTPAVTCWKFGLKTGQSPSASSEQIRKATEQELRSIASTIVHSNATQDEIRYQVMSAWAKRHGIDPVTRKYLLKKVFFPGGCEKYLFN